MQLSHFFMIFALVQSSFHRNEDLESYCQEPKWTHVPQSQWTWDTLKKECKHENKKKYCTWSSESMACVGKVRAHIRAAFFKKWTPPAENEFSLWNIEEDEPQQVPSKSNTYRHSNIVPQV